jgi:hypothetical protein
VTVTETCARCGEPREDGSRFCVRCGAAFDGGPPPSEPPAAGAPTERLHREAEPVGYAGIEPGTEPPVPPAPVARDPVEPAGAVPPARGRRRRHGRAAAVSGVLVVALGAFLPWVHTNFGQTGFAFPFLFPFSGSTGRTVSMGLVLLGLGALALLFSAAPEAGWLRRVTGVAVLAFPVGFAVQGLVASDAGRLLDTLGPGAYVVAVGGLVLALA